MSASMFAALLFTVPLLVLKHDTPLDAPIVRGLFNTHYVAAIVTATATSISFASAGRPGLTAGAAALALVAIALRKKIIPKMDSLGEQIQSDYRKTFSTPARCTRASCVPRDRTSAAFSSFKQSMFAELDVPVGVTQTEAIAS